jgi:uncharacterized protein (DUF2336 family)
LCGQRPEGTAAEQIRTALGRSESAPFNPMEQLKNSLTLARYGCGRQRKWFPVSLPSVSKIIDLTPGRGASGSASGITYLVAGAELYMSMLSFVTEVEQAIASRDPARRQDTLRRLTNLFLEQEEQLQEDHVEVFDEVILRLSRDLERRARQELSEKLSAVGKAPRKVVRSLAFDLDSRIARPVLEHSSRLDEDDLVMIARARGQEHLLAISKRNTLSERVTDVLVNRGDQIVVRSVAGNEGAHFSEDGFEQLIDKSQADIELQDKLQLRHDIPPRQMQRFVEIAQERVRRSLQNELGDDAASVVQAAVAGAASALNTGRNAIAYEPFEEAQRTVDARANAGPIGEEEVLNWVRSGRIDAALAALAHLAAVPVQFVDRAYRSPHYDPLLFIVRSLRFGWGTFKALLTAKSGEPPSADMLRGAFEAFQKLSVSTAQRVVRFTVARERAAGYDAA